MNIERVLEIIKNHQKHESHWDDDFSRGVIFGANDVIEDIVMTINAEVDTEMRKTIEEMPK